jgi:hypothetical protein
MDNATSYAYTRLSVLSEHDELRQYGPDLLLSDIRLVCAELCRLRMEGEGRSARYNQLFVERQRDIAAHKRLLAKVEAVSVAYAEQAVLLARIEALARAGDVRGVVEMLVRRGEKASGT